MIKYIVSVAYIKFEFDNGTEALEFAQTARMTNKSDKTYDVEIELIEIEEDN